MELSPNKIMYGFQTKESIDFLQHNKHEPDPIETYQLLETDAKNIIVVAQMVMKNQYNRCHTPRLMGFEIELTYAFTEVTHSQ